MTLDGDVKAGDDGSKLEAFWTWVHSLCKTDKLIQENAANSDIPKHPAFMDNVEREVQGTHQFESKEILHPNRMHPVASKP